MGQIEIETAKVVGGAGQSGSADCVLTVNGNPHGRYSQAFTTLCKGILQAVQHVEKQEVRWIEVLRVLKIKLSEKPPRWVLHSLDQVKFVHALRRIAKFMLYSHEQMLDLLFQYRVRLSSLLGLWVAVPGRWRISHEANVRVVTADREGLPVGRARQ